MTNTTSNDERPSSSIPMPHRPKRRTRLAAAMLSVGLVAVAGQALAGDNAAARSAPDSNPTAVEVPIELRTAMQANGMSGLSPASAAPIDQRSAVQRPVLRDGWMAALIAANASSGASPAASQQRPALPDPYPAATATPQPTAGQIVQAEIDAALDALGRTGD